jgi:hypothetical protein
MAEANTPEALPDPARLRKRILRRIWNVHYHGMARTAAARLIASTWATYEPADAPLVPGTREDAFDRLSRAGFRPVAWRRIADDLDRDLD